MDYQDCLAPAYSTTEGEAMKYAQQKSYINRSTSYTMNGKLTLEEVKKMQTMLDEFKQLLSNKSEETSELGAHLRVSIHLAVTG